MSVKIINKRTIEKQLKKKWELKNYRQSWLLTADQCGSSLLNSRMWPGILRDDISEKKLSRIDYAAERS